MRGPSTPVIRGQVVALRCRISDNWTVADVTGDGFIWGRAARTFDAFNRRPSGYTLDIAKWVHLFRNRRRTSVRRGRPVET